MWADLPSMAAGVSEGRSQEDHSSFEEFEELRINEVTSSSLCLQFN